MQKIIPLEPDFRAGNRLRIAIVGVGDVGSSTAFALMQAGIPRDLYLSDINLKRAEGEKMDLGHCVPFFSPCDLHVAAPADVQSCDLIIITAGVSQEPGDTRMDLIRRNADVFEQIIPKLAANNPRSILMIVTNPVDVMTRLALELSGFPPERIIGTGTVLDTARFRQVLSAHLRISSSNVHAYVIGEHGDSEVLVWSRSMVGPYHVEDYAERTGVALGEVVKAEIDREVRRAAYEIIERKGSTHFAIAMSTTRLVQSIFGDQEHLFTVSRLVDGLYGLSDVCVSIPTLLNRRGGTLAAELRLADHEWRDLVASAETIQRAWEGIRRAGG